MIDLSEKTVLVTGGSRGIGAATVRALAEAGANVVLHFNAARERAEALSAEIGADRCHLVQADLAEPGAATRLCRAASSHVPRIDVLVNNAGVFDATSVDDPDDAWRETWQRVLQINLIAAADLCREAIGSFRSQGGGKIINIASRAAFRGEVPEQMPYINIASRAAFRGEVPEQMPYGASKGALITLTKTIARGFAADGILAFAIAPGFTETEMVSANVDPQTLGAVIADIPLGEIADPQEIGALVAFLASDHARHLTGATFDVNGASYVR
jgi:NAD(P)-dependent dehydrogenase (short-subunit alcohol dehydrogenase family)